MSRFKGSSNNKEVQKTQQEVQKIIEALADTSQDKNKIKEDAFYNPLAIHKKPEAMITIIDDDCHKLLYTLLYPILKEFNIPISAAVVTGRMESKHELTITMDQYKEMRDFGLVEFVSHTVNHPDLSTVTLERAEVELRDSRKWLIENGGNPNHFVPPFGGQNEEVKKIIRKYYNSSFVSLTPTTNKPPLETYNIKRIDFQVDLETIKAQIDNAVATGSWVVISTHCHFPDFSVANFREMVSYAKSKAIKFASVGEAMRHFGNVVDLADPGKPGYGAIGADGSVHGVFTNNYKVIPNQGITNTTPATDFDSGETMTFYSATSGPSAGFPGAGTLITYVNLNKAYAHQEFIKYQSKEKLYRTWMGTGWGEFIETNMAGYYIVAGTGITSATSIDTFQTGETICHYGTSTATTAGFPGAGTLKTVKPIAVLYAYQRYVSYRKTEELHRFWNGTTWSAWVNLNGTGSMTTIERNSFDKTLINAGYSVFDKTLKKPVWFDGTNWVDATGTTV